MYGSGKSSLHYRQRTLIVSELPVLHVKIWLTLGLVAAEPFRHTPHIRDAFNKIFCLTTSPHTSLLPAEVLCSDEYSDNSGV